MGGGSNGAGLGKPISMKLRWHCILAGSSARGFLGFLPKSGSAVGDSKSESAFGDSFTGENDSGVVRKLTFLQMEARWRQTGVGRAKLGNSDQ